MSSNYMYYEIAPTCFQLVDVMWWPQKDQRQTLWPAVTPMIVLSPPPSRQSTPPMAALLGVPQSLSQEQDLGKAVVFFYLMSCRENFPRMATPKRCSQCNELIKYTTYLSFPTPTYCRICLCISFEFLVCYVYL